MGSLSWEFYSGDDNSSVSSQALTHFPSLLPVPASPPVQLQGNNPHSQAGWREPQGSVCKKGPVSGTVASLTRPLTRIPGTHRIISPINHTSPQTRQC